MFLLTGNWDNLFNFIILIFAYIHDFFVAILNFYLYIISLIFNFCFFILYFRIIILFFLLDSLFFLFVYYLFYFLFKIVFLINFDYFLAQTNSQVTKIEKQNKNSKWIKWNTQILYKIKPAFNTDLSICSINSATITKHQKMIEHQYETDFIQCINYKLSKLSCRICLNYKYYIRELQHYQSLHLKGWFIIKY